MPALTTLTIDDGQSTPVAHSFVPTGMPNGVAEFRDSDGVAVGDNILTVSSKLATRRKVSVRFKLPQTATLAGDGNASEVISRIAYVRMDFDFDAASTEAERDDAIAFARNLLSASQTAIDSVVVGNQDFY
jgi:hypothetical protein